MPGNVSCAGNRLHYFELPKHALTWYKQNCCPACGRVNGTGRLCDTTHACLNCGVVQCGGPGGRCHKCGGYLDGYVNAETKHVQWLKRERRRGRAR